jgi:D-serine deaminase-like pyridoxal phosphate-dependent protein
MDARYAIQDTTAIFSPALLFYKDLIRQNIAHAIAFAGGPERLRPHVKTHKTREIVQLEMAAGITKHKCATLAEAEMLASCGVRDVLLAYNLVGPNCHRMARLARAYPQCRFVVLADHPAAARALSDALTSEGQRVDVLLDLDVGQHRTGIAAGPAAVELYELIARLPGLTPVGLHVYDGHNHQESPDERRKAVEALLEPVLRLRETLDRKGLPTPRLVLGGTPTFPIFARMNLPGQECAPGTCFLHDHGYGSRCCSMCRTTRRCCKTRSISSWRRRPRASSSRERRCMQCQRISVRRAPCTGRRMSWRADASWAAGTLWPGTGC